MDTKQIIEAIKALQGISYTDRRTIQWAVEKILPATQRDADDTLKDVVRAWWNTHTTPVAIDALTAQEDWYESLPYLTHWEFLQDVRNTIEEVAHVRDFFRESVGCEDAEDAEDAGPTWGSIGVEVTEAGEDVEDLARKYVEEESLEDEFEAWQQSQNEIIWSTLWATSYRSLADAARMAGLVVMDAEKLDCTNEQYLIGAGSTGHSFLAAYFVPIYFLCNEGKRDFYTVTPGARFGHL